MAIEFIPAILNAGGEPEATRHIPVPEPVPAEGDFEFVDELERIYEAARLLVRAKFESKYDAGSGTNLWQRCLGGPNIHNDADDYTGNDPINGTLTKIGLYTAIYDGADGDRPAGWPPVADDRALIHVCYNELGADNDESP